MTPDGESPDAEFDAVAAIQALLSQKDPEPEPEADEPEPTPETPAEAESPAEPSAEVEGASLETKPEPEPPATVERREPAPQTAAKATEPNPQDELLTQLNSFIPQQQALFVSEFSDIKSDADLFAMGQKDPERYNRFVLQQSQLQRAIDAQRNLESARQQRFLESQATELKKSFPDYLDPVKGPAIRAEFTAFAKKQGFDDARMKAATAADILTLQKAMAWDKYQAEKASEPARLAAEQAKARDKAANAPPVQKPGAKLTNEKADRVQERAQKFAKSGHQNDLAALLIESGIA